MTAADNKSSPSAPQLVPEPAKQGFSQRPKIVFFAIILILIAGLLAAAFWLQLHGYGMPMPATGNGTDISQRMAVLERKVQALDAALNDLASRVDGIAAAPATAPPTDVSSASKPAATDFAHMQSEMASLTAAMSGLQNEAKQAASAATASQAEASASVGESIAFLQLRDAALAGRGFTNELSAMQTAAKNSDANLKDLFDKLVPLAANGAPSLPALREQFAVQASAADQTIAKAGARNWWERVLAELKGLISIRPLHGQASADATLQIVQTALAHDDLAAALDDMKNLPPEAQQMLDSWRQQAEARRTIDEALQELAARLIAGKSATPAQDAQ